MDKTTPEKQQTTLLLLAFVIVASYFTYFHKYAVPAAVFWDENYHIASAQKYLHGVYFMEQHPPLGKLLIALGEKIWHPNARTDQFLATDYGTDFGQGFSFVGYRFFSALLGWWIAPLLFWIFLLLTRNALWSTLLSFFYIFDNALIVHLRGAMLEGPLLFFSVTTILLFLLLLQELNQQPATSTQQRIPFLSLLFGISFACALTTKVVALVLILLVPALLFAMIRNARKMAPHRPFSIFTLSLSKGQLSIFLGPFLLGFLVTYIGVWHTHFALGSRVNPPLPDQGYYQASPEYRQILAQGQNMSLRNFPVMLKDSLRFVSHYNGGAPRLDLCKLDENGSPFYFWPLGARSINYRWETPNGHSYKYLYLQVNPLVWWGAFAGVMVIVSSLIAAFLFGSRESLQRLFLILVFLALYVGYMGAISRIDRVMYLYHYFLPLVLSFIIFALAFFEVRRLGKFLLTEQRKTVGLLVLGALIFASFQFYRPLTYYEPMTDAAFKKRTVFSLWELTCVKCPKVNALAIPRS